MEGASEGVVVAAVAPESGRAKVSSLNSLPLRCLEMVVLGATALLTAVLMAQEVNLILTTASIMGLLTVPATATVEGCSEEVSIGVRR